MEVQGDWKNLFAFWVGKNEKKKNKKFTDDPLLEVTRLSVLHPVTAERVKESGYCLKSTCY